MEYNINESVSPQEERADRPEPMGHEDMVEGGTTTPPPTSSEIPSYGGLFAPYGLHEMPPSGTSIHSETQQMHMPGMTLPYGTQTMHAPGMTPYYGTQPMYSSGMAPSYGTQQMYSPGMALYYGTQQIPFYFNYYPYHYPYMGMQHPMAGQTTGMYQQPQHLYRFNDFSLCSLCELNNYERCDYYPEYECCGEYYN